MSADNQNLIVGVISAIALIAGLIYTIISIRKTNMEILKLQLENQEQKTPQKNKPISQTTVNKRNSSLSVGFMFDVISFLFFLIGSINAIVEFISNTVPTIALITAQVVVLLYSVILFSTPKNTIFSDKEVRNFNLAASFGFVISLFFTVSIAISRIGMAFSFADPTTEKMVSSLVINLAIVPLLVFSSVTLYRIYRYANDNSTNQERA